MLQPAPVFFVPARRRPEYDSRDDVLMLLTLPNPEVLAYTQREPPMLRHTWHPLPPEAGSFSVPT